MRKNKKRKVIVYKKFGKLCYDVILKILQEFFKYMDHGEHDLMNYFGYFKLDRKNIFRMFDNIVILDDDVKSIPKGLPYIEVYRIYYDPYVIINGILNLTPVYICEETLKYYKILHVNKIITSEMVLFDGYFDYINQLKKYKWKREEDADRTYKTSFRDQPVELTLLQCQFITNIEDKEYWEFILT